MGSWFRAVVVQTCPRTGHHNSDTLQLTCKDGVASLLDCDCPGPPPGPRWLSRSPPGRLLSRDQGAQRDFDLFYPELEETTPTTPTTAEDETSYAVPVIHLPAEETDDDIEKVAADAILSMFPQDLLENNKKVRPVDVKIIEHDGYIDYEIEFIELAEYYDDYGSDKMDDLEISSPATERPRLEGLSAPELTFVDL